MRRRPTRLFSCLFRLGGISLLLLACLLAGCAAAAFQTATSSPVVPPTVSPEASVAPPPTGPSLSDLVPAQSLPARGEELWIIEKPGAGLTAEAHPPSHRAGILITRGGTMIEPSAKQTDVQADVTGCIATVDVRQQFTNPSNEVAEASYAFPLPQDAAVSEFVMTIGQRHIRGIVRERAEAEEIYRQAHSQGFLASLMVQRSRDVFVQKVANLEPHQQIDVEIRYFHTLGCHGGWLELVIPTASVARAPAADQPSGHDLSIAVHFNPGISIERVESPSHTVAVRMTGNSIADALLVPVPAERMSGRDFVVRCKLAGEGLKSSLLTERDGDGGVFSLLLVPPQDPNKLQRMPLHAIIDIDPGVGPAANSAAVDLLRSLSPQDRFQIVQGVPGVARDLTPGPLAATPQNIDGLVNTLSSLPSAGTGRAQVLGAALRQASAEDGHDGGRLHVVCLITDGHSGLHDMLAGIPAALGPSRIVAIGVGNSPDRDAIDAIARAGRGAAVYLDPAENSGPVLVDLIQCLSHPCITDIKLDWGGANVTEVLPQPTPDIFCGHAVWLTGRYRGAPPSTLIISGNAAGQPNSWTVRAGGTPIPGGHSPIACVWARRKISDLACEAAANPNPALESQVRQIALEYGLLSRYTAFILVDATGK